MSGGHESQIAKNQKFFSDIGLSAGTGNRALDLGCGSGYQTLALTGLGFEVVAVDTSHPLLDELQSLATGQAVTVVHGDMLEIETWQSYGPYDLVVCMGDTLVHVPSIKAVNTLLADVYKNLRAGGSLVLSFRDLTNELKGIERAIPVRLDENALMATFLEYGERVVTVNDLLFIRNEGVWEMQKSAYQKLRVSVAEVTDLLENSGYSIVKSKTESGFTSLAATKTVN